jgi:hypothetical protein
MKCDDWRRTMRRKNFTKKARVVRWCSWALVDGFTFHLVWTLARMDVKRAWMDGDAAWSPGLCLGKDEIAIMISLIPSLTAPHATAHTTSMYPRTN